ncbi:Bifunctional purine biosynthetic protein ade1 [Savitreella phatthalungensis]
MSTRVGVLALQGAFAEHVAVLEEFQDIKALEVRTIEELSGLDGLIIPGGESTVIGKQLQASGLGVAIKRLIQQGTPVYGTCAGLILLSNSLRAVSGKQGGQYLIGGLDVDLERNYFGRQINSFEAQVDTECLGSEPFHAVFIRAPAIHGLLSDQVHTLATIEHNARRVIVAVRQGNLIGTAFHPELTKDKRWHEYFLRLVREAKSPGVLLKTHMPGLKLVAQGKVRDIYEVDDQSLLFVTTDRMSAYDVIMQNGIPGKGKILTQLSEFWFEKLSGICQHHLQTTDVAKMPRAVQKHAAQVRGRAMLVKRLRVLPVEAIVRGFISGSAWKEYRSRGTVHGIQMPTGMQESQAFPKPIFTPSTKAEQGDHDENIHPDAVAGIIGSKHAERMAELAISLYTAARDWAASRGIIIADTKFEFGVDENDELVLVDEVLTPDSSRFWPAASYQVGRSQESFDKQYLRDWLTANGIDKKDGVSMPDDIVQRTVEKYTQVLHLIIDA